MGIPNRIKANPKAQTVGALVILRNDSTTETETIGRYIAEAFA
jgi:hypothetical protein